MAFRVRVISNAFCEGQRVCVDSVVGDGAERVIESCVISCFLDVVPVFLAVLVDDASRIGVMPELLDDRKQLVIDLPKEFGLAVDDAFFLVIAGVFDAVILAIVVFLGYGDPAAMAKAFLERYGDLRVSFPEIGAV